MYLNVSNELHNILVKATKILAIDFSDQTLRKLMDEVNKYELSSMGEIMAHYNEEMLLLSPPKEKVKKFLDNCLYDPRLDKIRKSLEDYLNDKTDIISNLEYK